MKKGQTLLVALGGNALIKKGQKGDIEDQFRNLSVPAGQIARLSRKYSILITHGNGPQVGDLLLRQESCTGTSRLPLEILVAQTQGQIGYMIESTLDSELMKIGVNDQPLVSLISYVVVDVNDPAFSEPSKPIGPVLSEEIASQAPYPVVNTARGQRRVVVSPKPVSIVEKNEIKKLVEIDFIVICCGGGGIPVIREERTFSGVDAVIDKDLASAKLAEEISVDMFLIATDVPAVYLDYGKATQKPLHSITVKEAKNHLTQKQFPPGSMGPKIEAAISFVEKSKKTATITSVENIEAAVEGRAGTRIVPD